MRVQDFLKLKQQKQKISMVTCYDYSFAKIVDQSNIHCILVGDSLAMTMYGHSTTIPATVDDMALHVAAVARGAKNKFIIGDMPFLSYRKGLKHTMNAVEKIIQAGAHAIKLEGCHGNLDLIRHIVESGVPVMGHLGLMLQSIHQMGGFKVQGRNEGAYEELVNQALQLEKAGCFAIVLELVVADIASSISKQLTIPTIGIGSGVETDGQVLVLQDLLGMNLDFNTKFVKKYCDLNTQVQSALNQFHMEVQCHDFPSKEHCFEE